jgi:molybdopterin/thiamine biosynthesis adenylyltransferase
MDFDYRQAFDRNMGILSEDDVARVRRYRIGIAGVGGCGGNHLLALTRLGFEHFTLTDPDTYELANMNRQAGATMHTLGREKAEVMAEMARSINPNVDVRIVPGGFRPETVDAFYEDIDIAVNGLDWFAIDHWPAFHDTARARGIYATCGAAPFGMAAAITFFGPETPSFADCFGFEDGDDSTTRLRKFVRGLLPSGFNQAYLPPELTTIAEPMRATRISSVSPTLYLCTALTASEVLLALLGKRRPILAPNVLQVDLFLRAMAVSHMPTYRVAPKEPAAAGAAARSGAAL